MIDKNIELRILSHLSKYGVGNKTEIADLFKGYPVNPDQDIALMGGRKGFVTGFLDKIKKRGLINYVDNTTGDDFDIKWDRKLEIEAEITEHGLQFLYLIKNQELTEQLSKSTISTNEQAILNFKLQKNLFYLTVILAAGSLVVSLLDYLK